ncbi:hypothetical protein [Romboutsia timonensis]|nr:hypothetical protein [Romboutsia timonensis]MDY3960155.1 hypothetical protein [Romboutsia timonensis]
MEQLYFEEVLDDLFISKTCQECKNSCKVLCLSKEAVIYCKKFKGENKC